MYVIFIDVTVDWLKFVVFFENSVNAHLSHVPRWQPVGALNMERRYTAELINNKKGNNKVKQPRYFKVALISGDLSIHSFTLNSKMSHTLNLTPDS